MRKKHPKKAWLCHSGIAHLIIDSSFVIHHSDLQLRRFLVRER